MLKYNVEIEPVTPLFDRMIAGKYSAKEKKTTETGLYFKELSDFTLTGIRPFKNATTEVDFQLKEITGLSLPKAGRQMIGRAGSVSCVAMNHYLLKMPRDSGSLILKLVTAFTGKAAFLDQSHAYCLLDISGPSVLNFFEKITSLDLRLHSFPCGCSTSTVMIHSHVILQRKHEDQFYLYLPRTHAFGAWQRIEQAADEYGYAIVK